MLLTMEEEEIIGILKESNREGLSITQLVAISKLSRSRVRIIIAKLDGARQVNIRKIGMAKIYTVKPEMQMKLSD